MVYNSWQIGDIVRLCVKVADFCGYAGNEFLELKSSDIQKDPSICTITCDRPDCTYYCLDTRNRRVKAFALMHYIISSKDMNCSNLIADKNYGELGSVLTDSKGIATIYHKVTEQDRLNYLDAIANRQTYDIAFCIDDPLASAGHPVVYKGISISSAPPPPTATHMVEYDVYQGVPDVLLNMVKYLSSIVTEIAKKIPTNWGWQILDMKIIPETKKIQLYLIKVGSVDLTTIAIDLFGIITAAIAIVLAYIYWGLGAAFYIVVALGLFLTAFRVYDLIVNQIIGRDEAITNLQNQNLGEKQLDDSIKNCMDTYNSSPKTKNDCLLLIQCQYNSYMGYINAMKQYFPAVNVDIQKKNLDTCYNDVISKVNANTIDCATAIATLTSCGTTSKTETTIVVYNNYNMGQAYVPPDKYVYPTCNELLNEEICKRYGCTWQNGICVKTQPCLITNPVTGDCLLSKKTALLIAEIGGALVGGYILYRVLTREKKST